MQIVPRLPLTELSSMVVQRFSTEALPVSRRTAAWREALMGIGLDATETTEVAGGRFTAYRSALGHDSVLIVAGPQALLRQPIVDPDHLWLGFMLEGVAMLTDGHTTRDQEFLCWLSGDGALLVSRRSDYDGLIQSENG